MRRKSPEGSPAGIPLEESLSLRIIFYTYILKSKSHGTYYYGSTDDIETRLIEHNSGRQRYTKGRRPWVVHYIEEFETRSEARQREAFFKSIDGYRYLKKEGII